MGQQPTDLGITLPVLNGDRTFLCPDESQPVSQAVHFARMRAGYEACDQCVFREADAEKSSEMLWQSHSAIRRSPCGVRGEYLNAIDRVRAGQLSEMFVTQIVRRVEASQKAAESDSNQASAPRLNTKIAVGYDNRHGAADVFAGVCSAVRQSGCDVVDCGLCTIASLLHNCRTNGELDAVIMVTGAGSPSGYIGLDVFFSDGQCVTVPWKEFGVSTRMKADQHLAADLYPDTIEQTLNKIRAVPVDGAIPNTKPSSSVQDEAELIFPSIRTSVSGYRSGRNSGEMTSVNAESEYRLWLSRWWQRVVASNIAFRVSDQLTESRLRWLNERHQLNLQIEMTRNSATTDKAHRDATLFVIGEDDRYLKVINSKGRTLPSKQLADWLNGSAQNATQHVTVHSIENDRRLILVDVALPGCGNQHDVVSDGLAIAGFISQVMQTCGHELQFA